MTGERKGIVVSIHGVQNAVLWIRRFHGLVLMVALPRYDRQMAINNLEHALVCVCVVRALMYEYEGTHAYHAA